MSPRGRQTRLVFSRHDHGLLSTKHAFSSTLTFDALIVIRLFAKMGINSVVQTRRWSRFVKIVGRFIYKDASLTVARLFLSLLFPFFNRHTRNDTRNSVFNIVVRRERDLSTLSRCFQSSVFRGIY